MVNHREVPRGIFLMSIAMRGIPLADVRARIIKADFLLVPFRPGRDINHFGVVAAMLSRPAKPSYHSASAGRPLRQPLSL